MMSRPLIVYLPIVIGSLSNGINVGIKECFSWVHCKDPNLKEACVGRRLEWSSVSKMIGREHTNIYDCKI